MDLASSNKVTTAGDIAWASDWRLKSLVGRLRRFAQVVPSVASLSPTALHYLQSVLTVHEAGLNGFYMFQIVSMCSPATTLGRSLCQNLIFATWFRYAAWSKKELWEGKKDKNNCVSPWFFWYIQLCDFLKTSSLPRKPSISLRCYKERMCPRTRHNSKRKSKNLATGLGRADFFDKGNEPSICGKDPNPSEFFFQIFQLILLHLKSLRTGCVPLLHSFLAWISLWFERWSRL